MTRRIHRCLTCTPDSRPVARGRAAGGFTRHTDRICSRCRRRGITNDGDVVRLPVELNLRGRGA